MKRITRLAAVLLIIVLGSFIFLSCNKNKSKFYEKYFNNFASRAPFTKAVSKINLDYGVSVFSYDSVSDVFVTKRSAANQYAKGEDDAVLTLYGFASLETQYVSPVYSNVISIKGDYAIVTKPYVDAASNLIDIIGVIKFRGENAGDRTDFGNTDCTFNAAYSQFTFVGDYIAVPGSKNNPTVTTNFTTFYEYKTKDKLLEAFKVGCDYTYGMVMYEGILVAVGKGAVYFFSPSNILQNGFLQINDYDYFKAFPEDTQNEYTDNISIQVYYLGNGWFVRSSRLESEIKFQGYNLTYYAYDAGSNQGKIMYALVRTDLFNFYTKGTVDNDWLLVDSVANAYTSDAYAYTSDALNNLAVATKNGRYEYSVPVLNPAKFIKDGYSIAYFYYTPYVDKGDYTYEISFCIIDSSANIVRVQDALMPIAFVDGVGIQNVDPTYQSLFGNLQCITLDNKKIDLKEITQGVNTFETYYAHNGIVIGAESNFADNTVYFGAVEAKTGKMVLPFKYDELTPFYGNYAIGLTSFENTKAYFKIDIQGKEALINDVVNVRHGVYVYKYGGKLGVKNYAGETLLSATYDKCEVYDVFTSGGSFQKSFAIATSGNYTYIFTLE